MRAAAVDTSLAAIAGKPAGMVTTGNSEDVSIPPFSACSFYFVANITGPGPADTGLWEWRIPNVAGIRVTRYNNSDGWQVTISPSASNAAFTPIVGSTGVRGLVAGYLFVQENQAGGKAKIGPSSVTDLSMPNPVTAFPETMPFKALAIDAAAVCKIAAAYPAVHTEYQRTAIMRKLLQMSGG